ncbi:MAG: endonuclease/exonuclease/phosphatase family protein [Bacteroidota bacterium]
MRKRYIVALLPILLFPFLSYAQDGKTLNVMSFNIRYDNPEDGKQNWHQRKANVVRMINFHDLDIIGMQEVLVNQLDYLKKELPQYATIGVGREDGKEKGEFVPIFYKRKRFTVLKKGTFWLSETPETVSRGWDAALERIVTWAVLRDKDTGKEFVFMNTHFDHRGKQARLESAKLIKHKASELSKGLALIVTGDFNLVPESEAIELLLRPSDGFTLLNTNNLAKHTYGPEWTTSGFDNRPFEDRKTIDYVFVKGVKKVDKYAVFAEKLNALFLSDHCPVFAQLRL